MFSKRQVLAKREREIAANPSACPLLLSETSLTFVPFTPGKHGADVELLKYAYDFEQRTQRRVEPPVTPALESDYVDAKKGDTAGKPPTLEVRSAERVSEEEVMITGTVNGPSCEVILEARIDGKTVPASQIEVKEGLWSLRAQFIPYIPAKAIYGGYGEVVGNVLVVLLARCTGGCGWQTGNDITNSRDKKLNAKRKEMKPRMKSHLA